MKDKPLHTIFVDFGDKSSKCLLGKTIENVKAGKDCWVFYFTDGTFIEAYGSCMNWATSRARRVYVANFKTGTIRSSELETSPEKQVSEFCVGKTIQKFVVANQVGWMCFSDRSALRMEGGHQFQVSCVPAG